MPKELVISAAPHETRVAILEDGQLCEIYIEREKEFALVGSIYKGRVTRVLPGMQSAFVDIGLDSDAFLYVGDFLENLEDYDHVVNAVEGKVEKMEQQGGNVFAPAAATEAPAAEPSAFGAPPGAGEPRQPAGASFAGAESSGSELPVEDEADRQPFFAGDSSSPFPPRQPSASAPPPASFRQDRGQGQGRGPDRGQGRGQGQQGQGNDRGGRQRGGRFRRGRGGSGDRRGGRDLPQSKYASAAPRPYTPSPSRPYEPPTEDELPADYTPIILPGESLAKYKDRAPGASSATGSTGETSSSTPAPPTGLNATTSFSTAGTAPALPAPLYATPEKHGPSEGAGHSEEADLSARADLSEPADSQAETMQAGSVFASDEYRAPQQTLPEEVLPPALTKSPAESPVESPIESDDTRGETLADTLGMRHEHGDAAGAPGSGAELSDEEVTALAEQLAEARQEEATAKADADAKLAEPESAEETAADEDADDELADGHNEDEAEELTREELAETADDAPETDGPNSSEIGAGLGSESHALAESAEPGNPERDDAGLAPRAPQRPMSARVSDPQRARFQRPMRRGGRQQGNRPQPRRQDQRQQPVRRPQLISEMLKAGQEIIVQIAKEPLGKKGARITSHVALPGRFLVYMPTVNHIGVSRRIGSAEERSRLRRVVTESKGTFPGGFIVRTAAEGAPDDEIRADVEFLGRTWDKIRTQSEPRRSPSLLHRDLNLVERILRDYVSNDYTAVWIDSEEEFSKVVDFVSRFQPKLVSRVKLYTKATPIFEEFGIQQELDKALRPKVWLKSGGYIVINHTEALVAIDVNTGKYVGRGSTRLEDTIVKTNLEAVKEIVRQVRLRDLGGIIILDFIDMEERRNREKVMAALDSALRADRAPSKALPFNEFGLVAVTRKRTKQALERVLCQPCPYCTGSGMVKSVPTICYEIQAEAKKMSADLDATSLTLRVHPEIAKALKTREAALIEELEQGTRKSVIIQADPTLHWEQYDIY